MNHNTEANANKAAPIEAAEIRAEKSASEIDIEKALAPRSLGSEDAPIKIEEFASLTCSHCARFHINTFAELKEKYIDTGKVKFTLTDFPLNAAALDATLLARCLPEKHYFKFVSLLFKTQDQWAFDAGYKDYLRQNAKLLGASDELIDACWSNEDLKTGVVQTMQDASASLDIRSTPSFIINGTERLTGAQKIDQFERVFERLEEK